MSNIEIIPRRATKVTRTKFELDNSTKPMTYNEWKHEKSTENSVSVVGDRMKISKKVIITPTQAYELNIHAHNTGKSYELFQEEVKEEPKKRGRKAKEETKTEE